MNKSDEQILKNYRERAKKQNERAKELWDIVSCRLPKGTKERIAARNCSVNKFIIDAVLERLENMEMYNEMY